MPVMSPKNLINERLKKLGRPLTYGDFTERELDFIINSKEFWSIVRECETNMKRELVGG